MKDKYFWSIVIGVFILAGFVVPAITDNLSNKESGKVGPPVQTMELVDTSSGPQITVEEPKAKTTCIDVTSYDYNWDNDMKCTTPDGEVFYTDYEGAAQYED